MKRLPPIDLDLDNPEQKALWEHYQKLTETGEAANWIRETLAASIPAKPRVMLTANGNNRQKIIAEQRYEDVE